MKPLLIAEISSNHNADLLRAKDMIKLAADIGFDAVKFQLFRLTSCLLERFWKSELHRERKMGTAIRFYSFTVFRQVKIWIEIWCTLPLNAISELAHVDFFKISSYELLWLDLFQACCLTGKPIIFSTGMANLEELKNALEIISVGKSKDITVLKCTSDYPCKPEDVHLESIETIKKLTKTFDPNIKIGLSDHTRSIGVILRAIHKYEVSAIESILI